MIECPKCGKQLDDSTEKCPFCSATIRKEEVPFIPEEEHEERKLEIEKRGFVFKRDKENILFSDSGQKLKQFAKIFFTVQTVIGIIVGLLVGYSSFLIEEATIATIAFGIITAIAWILINFLFAWIISIGLYAFGDLVDSVQSINDKLSTFHVTID